MSKQIYRAFTNAWHLSSEFWNLGLPNLRSFVPERNGINKFSPHSFRLSPIGFTKPGLKLIGSIGNSDLEKITPSTNVHFWGFYIWIVTVIRLFPGRRVNQTYVEAVVNAQVCNSARFSYARLKKRDVSCRGNVCPSVRPSVRVFRTCFEISIWN